MIERLEVYLQKVLSHYAEFNAETMKWEITFDELNEMIQFYLDKYWEECFEKFFINFINTK